MRIVAADCSHGLLSSIVPLVSISAEMMMMMMIIVIVCYFLEHSSCFERRRCE